MHTVVSKDREALTVAHIQKYYDGGYKGCGSECVEPLGTVTAADHNALCLAHVSEFRGVDVGSSADTPLRAIASHDHSSLCLSHITKFKGTNIGQSPKDPLQTITTESGRRILWNGVRHDKKIRPAPRDGALAGDPGRC